MIKSISLFFCFNLVFGEKFLVTLKKDVATTTLDDPKIYLIDNFNVGDFSGFILETEYTKKELEQLSYISSVEEDKIVQLDPDIFELDIIQSPDETKNLWGLDRIDQPSLPLDKKDFNPVNNGENIHIYVIDTGIRTTHNEFKNGNRAKKGWDFAYNDPNPDDKYGHGTHVASTATGQTVGVASGATVVGVKVLSDIGSGLYSNVIKGIEWAVKDAKKNNVCGIISMSLGGSKSELVNKIVNSAVDSGVNVVVSAGNSNTNACNSSPASAEKAITVGSTTMYDYRSSFSNYGSCVDIFAPGSSIYGAWKDSDESYRTLSGTSMSAPHVTGALAVYLKQNGCKASIQTFMNDGVNNKLFNIPSGTVNKLLQVRRKFLRPSVVSTPRPTKPTRKPTNFPTKRPTKEPTNFPTKFLPTFSPTLSPTITCPPEWAMKYCNKKPNGKYRSKKECKKRNVCSWCKNGNNCQPKNSCNDPDKFLHCPGKPVTPEPTSLNIIWEENTKFELNAMTGKFTIEDVKLGNNRLGPIIEWKNNLVKKENVVFMSIGGYNNNKNNAIMVVIVKSVEDNLIKFVIGNPDNDKIVETTIDINFYIF